MGACLRKHGISFEILEQADAVGNSWRNHYERLHLHTAKTLSALPHFPFPKDYPRFPSRQQVVDYLEAYAKAFDLRPHFQSKVANATRIDGSWSVELDGAEKAFTARNLVIATSYNDEPNRPNWPGQESFQGQIIHSRDYRNAKPFKDHDVLIVGLGNTGGEIALDLHEKGARPSVALRSPIHVMPRQLFGLPIQFFSIVLSKLPNWLVDFIGLKLAKLRMGDMTKFGLERPKLGPATMVREHGRIPLIDIGTVDLIRAGKLPIYKNIERFEKAGVVFEDGQKKAFHSVLLCTGYRARIDKIFPNAERLINERGYPKWHGEEVPLDDFQGLYFLGFSNPIAGALRQIHFEAVKISASIASQ